jgi:hypothetical protein
MGSRSELINIINSNKRVKKHITAITKMPLKDEVWISEIESMQINRGLRSLNTSALLQSSVKIGIDSNLDNQLIRSRCTEIKMKAMKQSVLIEETSAYIKAYVSNKYATSLKKVASTVTERKQFMDYILQPIERIKDKLSFVIKLCDAIIEDCDAAGHTLYRIGLLLDSKAKDK